MAKYTPYDDDPRELMMEEQGEIQIDIREYISILWRRKWAVITVFLVVLGTAALKTFTATRMYRGRGLLSIEKELNILSFEEMFQFEAGKREYLMTQYEILKSRSLAETTLEMLPTAPQDAKKRKGELPETEQKRRKIDGFLANLEIKPVRETTLVEVLFSSPDPERAAETVNALIDSYIDMNIQHKYAATEQASSFLTEQVETLRKEIARKENELQKYGQEKNIIALSDTETTVIDKLDELNRALTAAQIERVNKEAVYNEIRNASADYVPDAAKNPLIEELRREYDRLTRDYAQKQESLGPDYPEMQRLRRDIETTKSALEREMKNLVKGAYSEYQAALKKEKSLEDVFNQQKAEAFLMNSNAVAFNSLKMEVENLNSLMDSLLRRQSETGVSARLQGMKTSNIKVVDRAEVPGAPFSPNVKVNLLLGLMLGLVGGAGLAFFLNHIDDSVKSTDDVERYGKLPALGIVPAFSVNGHRGYGYGYGDRKKRTGQKGKDAGKGNETAPKPGDRQKPRGFVEGEVKAGGEGAAKSIELIPHYSPKSAYSESYRAIRSSLLLSSADPNLKMLTISSPLPKEGKTSTVVNLAVTLAQAGKKVLVVDADLRKPQLHRIFRIKNLNGLTSYIASHIEIKELIKSTKIPGLFIINAGPIPPNPSELLGSDRMKRLVDILRQPFDYTLFDTPPILAVSDALDLGSKTDGLILIVWGEKTSRKALQKAREKVDLTRVKTLGVIINNLKIRKHDYYHHYYYQYYYGSDKRV